MENLLKLGIGSILTSVTYFLGGWDIALQTLLLLIVLDFTTGVFRAITEKKLNSKVGVKGIIKKVGYLVIVALSVVLDRIVGDTGAIRTIVIYFFIANEGLSIVENWALIGLPMPPIIKDTLEQLKNKNNKS